MYMCTMHWLVFPQQLISERTSTQIEFNFQKTYLLFLHQKNPIHRRNPIHPDWFSHQSAGPSICFQMPPDAKDNHLGMVYWVVYEDGRHFFLIHATIINKTDGTEFKCSVSRSPKGVNSWVRYVPKPFPMRGGDIIEVSFTTVGNLERRMHGVHLVYKSDNRVIDCKKGHAIDVEEANYHSKRLKL